MKRSLLWDAGPGEMRAGLIEAGQLTEFRIIRQRRDHALYAAGEHYTARVTARLSKTKAMVTLGGERDALLEQAPGVNEGALLAVRMTRAPIPEPGRWKLPVVRPAPEIAPQREPGWHFSDEPWVLFLRKMSAEVDEIVCGDAQMLSDLRSDLGANFRVPMRIDAGAIAEADFDSLIEQAIRGEFPIAGGMLSIERTRAMTVVDIDGSGDPLALNLAAAAEIPRLLRLLDIGGPVGIDFVTMPDGKLRKTVDAALEQACAVLGAHKRTAINGFGFAQIVRSRLGPSVPELLSGITPGRTSLETRAIALLRQAGRSVGFGARRFIAPPAVIELIRRWPEEVLALQSSLGAAIELIADPAATGYGQVHVSQS